MLLPSRTSQRIVRLLLVLAFGLGPRLTVIENRLLIYPGIIIIIACLLTLGLHGLKQTLRRRWVRMILFLPFLAILLAPFALSPVTALRFVPESLLPLLIGAILMLAANKRFERLHRDWILYSGVFGLTAAALMSLGVRSLLWQSECHPVLEMIYGAGRCPFLSDLNQTDCILAVLMWPVLIGLWRKSFRVPAITLAPLFCITIMTGESQSAMMGLVLSVIVLPLAMLLGARRILLATSIVMAFVVVATPFVLPTAIDQMRSLNIAQHLPNSGLHRLAIWQEASVLIQERPLIGWGLNNSRRIGDHFGTIDLVIERGGGQPPLTIVNTQRIPNHPHNASLEWWLDLGFLGVVTIVAMVLIGLRRSWRRLEGSCAIATLCTAIAAFSISQTAYGIWQPWWLTTMFFAVMLIRALTVEKTSRSEAPGPL